MEGQPSKSLKHDWYQTESTVVVNVMIKNMKPENVRVDVTERQMVCTVKVDEEERVLSVQLAHEIQPSQLRWKVLPSKIEVSLKKAEYIHWSNLKLEEGVHKDAVKIYPSSQPAKKDWDKLVCEIKKEEADEKLEGDAAVNQLFQKIYADGSEETRRAMNKSFMESGGTVLSTNWKDVSKKEVEIKPPDGMEWKKWDE